VGALRFGMPAQNDERDRRLLQLWLKQPIDKRTMQDLREFCMRLHQKNPELLPLTSRGDPYQHMKAVLVAYTTPGDAPSYIPPTLSSDPLA
jgi:hypothetical protein